jgi:integrase
MKQKEKIMKNKTKLQGRIIFDMDAMTREGKVRFRCRNVQYDGYEKYRLYANPKKMKRIDREFDSEEQARSFYHRWQANNDPIGQGYRTTTTRLNNKQLQDATDAYDRLPDGATLLELVKQFDLTNQTHSVSVLDAWNEYREFNIRTEKNRDGSWRSKSTIIEQDFVFKGILNKLGNRLVKEVVAEDLSPFWQSRESSQTRLNHFKKIKAFFSWCLKKEYHFKDILALEKTPKVERESFPEVLTIDETKKLIEVCSRPKYERLKPFVFLCLFGGLRAGEANGNWEQDKLLKWDDFTLQPEGNEKPFLSLPFVGKMKSSRNVDLSPNLVKVLLQAKDKKLSVIPSKNGINLWKKLRKESGLSSKKPNCLRHTAISYFYRHNPFTKTETLDESLMTRQFGNSEDVRDRHYKNVNGLTINDAKEFWRLI